MSDLGGKRASWASRVDALRREGRVDEALDLARHAYRESPQSLSLKRSYGWALYAKAKQEADAFFEALKERSPQGQARRESALTRLDFMISEYAETKLPKSDLSLSLLLAQVTRPHEPPPSLPRVLNWVGIEGLREEDSHAHEGARGTLYPSLLERLAERCAVVAIKREKPRACALALTWIHEATSRAAPLINPEQLSAPILPLTRLSGQLDEAAQLAQERLSITHNDAVAWREWSLCERERAPLKALWLGVRAAHEAGGQLTPQARTLWAEHLAQVAREADEPQLALALGLWALEQRALAGVARDDTTHYLTRSLGGESALHRSVSESLQHLDERAMSESEALLKGS